jgi:hypothetical protein
VSLGGEVANPREARAMLGLADTRAVQGAAR